jgi:hypothetical protein
VSLFSFGPTPVKRAIAYNENLWPVVVFVGLVTVGALWYGGWWTWQNHLFADHARQMEAKVLRKYVVESQGKHGPIYTPHLQYGYQVGNLLVNCDVTVGSDIYDQVEEGGDMPIKYLPEDVTNNRLDDTADDYQATVKANFGLIAGAVGLFFTIAGAFNADRRKKTLTKLKTAGLSASGRVTSVETERVGKQMQTFLRFEFTDNYGRVIEGRTPALTSKQKNLWTQDKIITVYYDPANSTVFTVNPSVVS